MIDYIEGVLTINKLMKDLHAALLAHQYEKAKELCLEVNVQSRLLHQQIRIQTPEQ
jgi:hypothetical protein